MSTLENLKKEIVGVLFVKWDKGELKREMVLTTESELPKVRRQYRRWTEAKPIGRKCPKCSNELLDYGLVHATEGVVQVIRCRSEKCDHAETIMKYTKEQVKLLRTVFAPTKHCGKVMSKSWKYCPYCGQQL